MLRKVLSFVIGASIAMAPTGSVSAQEYIFRYKKPVNLAPANPDMIGIGNDIVAYYTAPLGKDFQKRIPVKTREVDRWVIDEGDLPSGIRVQQADGSHEGTPDVEQSLMHRLSGYDASNNRIAKAEVHFDIRKPEGIEVPVDFLAHKGQYSYNVIPSPLGIAVERWDPWMQMPDGMDMRNEAIEGIPTEARDYPVMWQGYDYLNRPVAYAWGDLRVVEGPSIDPVADQHIDLARSNGFSIQAVSHDIISTPVYQLISLDGDRPEGIGFDAETGKLTGKPEAFDWSGDFKIRVTDTYDGLFAETTPEFTLSTAPATFGMDDAEDIITNIGVNKNFGFDVATNIPGLTWSLAPESGPLPPGMTIKPETQYAYITDAPTRIGVYPGIILMASAPGFEKRTASFSITVNDRKIETDRLYYPTRAGKDIDTPAIKITQGRVDPVTFEFATPSSVPAGMTLDADTGALKMQGGFAQAGQYYVSVIINNGDKQKPTVTWSIKVFPDLELSYEDSVFTRFGKSEQANPVVDREKIAGDAKWSIDPALPTGLVLNSAGRIIHDYRADIPKSAIGTATYVVTLNDAAAQPIPSKSFTIEIKDRPDMELSEGIIEIERYVRYNQYNAVRPVVVKNAFPTLGSARYSVDGDLPEKIELSELGYFTGSTSVPAGDYPDLTITVVDGDGFQLPFGPFTLRVKEATSLSDLNGELNKTETWVEGQDFSFKMPVPSNAKQPVTWTLTDAPAGVSVDDAGNLVGKIGLTGTHVINFKIGDDTGRDEADGSITLDIQEPFEFGKVTEWLAYKSQRFEYPEGTVTVERGIKPFTWAVKSPQPLPSGWNFYNGQLSGTPNSASGGFPLVVEMTDKAKVKKDFEVFVKFNPPKPITVSYPEKTLNVEATTGLPLSPKVSVPDVKIASWAPVSGLPMGVGYDTATGEFVAKPYPAKGTAGIYNLEVVPRPVDQDVKLEESPIPVTLKIGYSGAIDFKGATFRERVGERFSRVLGYSRAVAPVKMTALSVEDGFDFSAGTYTLSGKLDVVGTHTGAVIKLEENDDPAFDREATATFSVEAVAPVTMAVQPEMTFGQFDHKSVPAIEVLNVIGDGVDDATKPDVTYKIAEGYPDLPKGLYVNELTGAVEGAAEVFGEFGPFRITAFDAYGDEGNSNEFSVKVGERAQMTLSYPTGFSHFRRYGTQTSAPAPANGYGPYTWSIDRQPPAGISFDPVTGVISSSSDTLIEAQTFTVTAIDSKGGKKGTAQAEVVVGVSERPALDLNYSSPVIAFKRHISDGGKAPTLGGRVSRGGTIRYELQNVGGRALPDCVSFDTDNGTFSTDPACTILSTAADYKVIASDATWREDGNSNGRDEYMVSVSVGERPAIELDYLDYDKSKATFGFQRHNVKTVAPDWTNPITSDVDWTITPQPPTGITFNTDGSITVDTTDLIDVAPYTVTIKDDFDGIDTFEMNLGVAERDKLVFEQTADHEVPLNQPYELTLSVENVIGDTVNYEVVSGTLPTNISFDVDGTGKCGIAATICGTPDVKDHNKEFSWTVKASDAFNGISDDFVMTFKVVEDATDMKVTYATPAKGRVGYAWSLAAPTVEFAVGNFTFTSPDLASVGLILNTKTGEITGTPNTTFDREFPVTVTDKLGASREVTVALHIVSAPTPWSTVPTPVKLTFNYDIPADQQPVYGDIEAPGAFTVEPQTLPPGISLDPLSGELVGIPEDIGVYGPYTVTLKDALPGTFPTVFDFDIAMNDDPIEVTEIDVLTKVGFPFTTTLPEYGNALGKPTFSSPELSALGLDIDTSTGIVTGSISEPMDIKPNLLVRDRTIRTTSIPVNLEVLPRLRLTAPTTVNLTAFETVTPKPSVTPAFVAGDVRWDPIASDLLPAGVVFDHDGAQGCGAVATFCGTPLKAQTMEPITVTATDRFGNGQVDPGASNPITIIVRKGVFAMEFKPGDTEWVMPEATKRTTYSHDLVAAGMFEWEGMDLSAITFGLVADPKLGETIPEGLTIKKNGILSGMPADEGVYDFRITATYSNKPSVSGKYRITTKRPETKFELAEHVFAAIEKKDDFTFDFSSILTLQNIPLKDVKWAMVAVPNEDDPPVALPLPDMALNPATGVLSGKPLSSGNFKFVVTASYEDRQEKYTAPITYSLVIKAKDYRFKAIEASESTTPFTCGIATDDRVMCWGKNEYGVLGYNPSVASSAEPEYVIGLTEKAKSIESGNGMMCAVTESDRVACWGRGTMGGNGWDETYIAKYIGSYKAKSVSVGNSHACMVTTDNNAVCWGYNAYYQTGGSDTRSYSAVTVQGLEGVTAQISAGWRFTCALTTSGEAKCWGDRPQSDKPSRTLTTYFATGVSKVIASNAQAYFHMEDGRIRVARGSFTATPVLDYDAGEQDPSGCALIASDTLGLGCTSLGSNRPIVFPGDIVSFSRGYKHACAVIADGRAYCVGNPGSGALGSSVSSTNVPVLVTGP